MNKDINFMKFGKVKKIVYENGEVEIDENTAVFLFVALPNCCMEKETMVNSTMDFKCEDSVVLPVLKNALKTGLDVIKKLKVKSPCVKKVDVTDYINSKAVEEFFNRCKENKEDPGDFAEKNPELVKEMIRATGCNIPEEAMDAIIQATIVAYNIKNKKKREDVENEKN